jgi:hypothetical protein
MSRYYTFHLTLNGARTTVSLDPNLANYLAKSLGALPETPQAKKVIQTWAAKSLANWVAFDPYLPLSAQVRQRAIEQIVDPKWAD